MTPSCFANWPGKSSEGDVPFHPAVYHMLDVGAVLRVLIKKIGFGAGTADALCLLGALHDVGKISQDFKAMIETGQSQSARHWEVSMAWLQYFDKGLLGERLGGEEFVRRSLYASAAGHHGGPPNLNSRQVSRMMRRAGPDALLAVEFLLDELFELFPEANLEKVSEALTDASCDWRNCSNTLSWWFAGVLSVSDWIGSNEQWFPATNAEFDIGSYWRITQERSEVALRESGINAASVSRTSSAKLFSFDRYTPMQEAALNVDLPLGKMVAVLEDATGSGKTEAALILAHRMMKDGKGEGVFFALPSMSTSNAMFSRLQVLGGMFEGAPSIALTHSKAALHQGFASLTGTQRSGSEDIDDMTCTDWFSDGKRKSLLAQIGVGTIDQALLGILPTRFCALRLYALSQKILIIDEAHDYDPYMQRELEALLSFQAALGGSAILMTATLPSEKRRQFVNAFQPDSLMTDSCAANAAYPRLSIFGGSPVERAIPASTHPEHCTIEVRRSDSYESVIDLLLEAAKNGSGCAFVRNSVDEAICTAELLESRGAMVVLHHARFALSDRLDNEDRVIELFGKNREIPGGWIVVGTQVLEQSLDIDFDVMVSDLAPIGALIQRAGRIWRHRQTRNKELRCVDSPVLHVLSPDPEVVENSDWGKSLLGGGWYVYSLPLLWRTARILFKEGQIIAPSSDASPGLQKANIRRMIESVESENLIPLPDLIASVEYEVRGQALAERAHSQQNVLSVEDPYSTAVNIFSEERFPTRLGEDQIILRLAKYEEGTLKPWVSDVNEFKAWAMSEVSISRSRWETHSKGLKLNPDVERLLAQMKEWQQRVYRICPVGSDGQLQGLSVKYDAQYGLHIARTGEEKTC